MAHSKTILLKGVLCNNVYFQSYRNFCGLVGFSQFSEVSSTSISHQIRTYREWPRHLVSCMLYLISITFPFSWLSIYIWTSIFLLGAFAHIHIVIYTHTHTDTHTHTACSQTSWVPYIKDIQTIASAGTVVLLKYFFILECMRYYYGYFCPYILSICNDF